MMEHYNAVMNKPVCISSVCLCTLVGSIFKSEIAGLRNLCICIECCWISFHASCIQWVRIFFFSCFCLKSVWIFDLCEPDRWMWYLRIISISLFDSFKVPYVFFSSENNLSFLFFYWFVVFFLFIYIYFIYIREISPINLDNLFVLISCLMTIFMVAFAMQKMVIFIQLNLLIFFFGNF